jgi:hypothetical protein
LFQGCRSWTAWRVTWWSGHPRNMTRTEIYTTSICRNTNCSLATGYTFLPTNTSQVCGDRMQDKMPIPSLLTEEGARMYVICDIDRNLNPLNDSRRGVKIILLNPSSTASVATCVFVRVLLHVQPTDALILLQLHSSV